MSFGVAILILAVLYLAVVNRTFRRVAGLLSILIVAAFLIIIGTYEERAKNRRERADTLIKSSQIELIDPRVSFSANGSPDLVTGRVRNSSGYPMDSFKVRLLFQDCVYNTAPSKLKNPKRGADITWNDPKGDANAAMASEACDTVGDDTEEIYQEVPPGQSRDFEHYITGVNISSKGHVEWTPQLISVSAHID